MSDWDRFEVRLKPSQGVSLHPVNHSIPVAWFHQHLTDYDFWFITNGQEKLIDQFGREYAMRRGVGLLFQPNSIWSCQPEPPPAKPLQLAYFHFDIIDRETGKKVERELMEDFPTVFHCHEVHFVEATCRRILQLGYLWKKEKRYERSPAYRLACDLLKILIRDVVMQDQVLGEEQGVKLGSSRYGDLMALMSNLNDDPRRYESVEAMAKELHMSSDHMGRQFKQIFGKSPIEALIESRIARAQNLLAGTEMSVAEIAEEVGYENVHYFSRQFKEKNGKSPLSYRKSCVF